MAAELAEFFGASWPDVTGQLEELGVEELPDLTLLDPDDVQGISRAMKKVQRNRFADNLELLKKRVASGEVDWQAASSPVASPVASPSRAGVQFGETTTSSSSARHHTVVDLTYARAQLETLENAWDSQPLQLPAARGAEPSPRGQRSLTPTAYKRTRESLFPRPPAGPSPSERFGIPAADQGWWSTQNIHAALALWGALWGYPPPTPPQPQSARRAPAPASARKVARKQAEYDEDYDEEEEEDDDYDYYYDIRTRERDARTYEESTEEEEEEEYEDDYEGEEDYEEGEDYEEEEEYEEEPEPEPEPEQPKHKLVLTAEQKLERETKAIGKVIRSAIKSKRSFGGKAMKNIAGVFKAIDKDGSGDLDHAEFKTAMKRLGLGLTPDQITTCIEVLDKDGDGEVSLDEFMALVKGDVKVEAKAPNFSPTRRRRRRSPTPEPEPKATPRRRRRRRSPSPSPEPEKPKWSPTVEGSTWGMPTPEPVSQVHIKSPKITVPIWEKLCDTKMKHTSEQKIASQTENVGRIIRSAISSKRSLGGNKLKDIKSVFLAMDKDGSGDLDHEEFAVAMNRLGLGLTPDQINQCINVLDVDGDGEVSYDEFMALVNKPVKNAVNTISAANAFAAAGEGKLKLPKKGIDRTKPKKPSGGWGAPPKREEKKKKSPRKRSSSPRQKKATPGMLERDTKLKLTPEEKLARQTEQIGKIVRAGKSHDSLLITIIKSR